MAVANAGQESLYPSLEDSALWLQRNPTLDAFRDGEVLSAAQSAEIYGIALHAFTFLELRYGAAQLEVLITTMHDGKDFESAFAQALGLPVALFQRDFENYLRLRAFRGTGRAHPALTQPRRDQ